MLDFVELLHICSIIHNTKHWCYKTVVTSNDCNQEADPGWNLSSRELSEVHFLIGRCQSELHEFHHAQESYTAAIKYDAKHAYVSMWYILLDFVDIENILVLACDCQHFRLLLYAVVYI